MEAVQVNSGGCNFDAQTHEYSISDKKYTSATQKIKAFVPEFKAQEVAAIIARLKKIPITTLLKTWKLKGEMAIGFGNFSHATAHMYHVNKSELEAAISEGTSPHVAIIYNMLEKLTKKFRIVEMETARVSLKFEMGYTPDLILESIETEEEPIPYYVMADFKTTKYATADDYKADKGKMPNLLAAPFKNLNLRDVPLDKAAIQLSLYALALAHEETFTYWDAYDLPNVKRWVMHIPMNMNKYTNGYKIFEVPNVDALVLSALAT